MRYLSSGVNLIQNLREYYEAASVSNKQKLVGSTFPENFSIENGKYRTRLGERRNLRFERI